MAEKMVKIMCLFDFFQLILKNPSNFLFFPKFPSHFLHFHKVKISFEKEISFNTEALEMKLATHRNSLIFDIFGKYFPEKISRHIPVGKIQKKQFPTLFLSGRTKCYDFPDSGEEFCFNLRVFSHNIPWSARGSTPRGSR
jgi:hypothetical protein